MYQYHGYIIIYIQVLNSGGPIIVLQLLSFYQYCDFVHHVQGKGGPHLRVCASGALRPIGLLLLK